MAIIGIMKVSVADAKNKLPELDRSSSILMRRFSDTLHQNAANEDQTVINRPAKRRTANALILLY
jgi:hypothetical protein